MKVLALAAIALSLLTCGCNNDREVIAFSGPQGAAGVDGQDGKDGPPGPAGAKGEDGKDGSDAVSINKSGSRLMMRAIFGEDGSQQFVGFHDSLLDVDCNYEKLQNDGKANSYCYPVWAKRFDVMPNLYADDQCTVYLAAVEETYDFARDSNTIYTVGPIAAQQDGYKLNDAGACVLTISGVANGINDPKPAVTLTRSSVSTFVRGNEGSIQ